LARPGMGYGWEAPVPSAQLPGKSCGARRQMEREPLAGAKDGETPHGGVQWLVGSMPQPHQPQHCSHLRGSEWH